MRHVDTEAEPRLERILSEMRTQAKRDALAGWSRAGPAFGGIESLGNTERTMSAYFRARTLPWFVLAAVVGIVAFVVLRGTAQAVAVAVAVCVLLGRPSATSGSPCATTRFARASSPATG